MTPRFNDYLNFIRERQAVYVRRAAGKPYPWTDDPVLGSGHFCNVFRENDRVTKWIDANIRKPFADHRHLWLMLAIARYVNWPPTLQWLMDYGASWPSSVSFEPRYLTAALEAQAASGVKVYTGAYMIRAESDPNKEWYSWSKHRYIAEIVIGRLWEDRAAWEHNLLFPPPELRRLESIWTAFQAPHYVGWGPFMAYEVVTDLRHTRYLSGAQDIKTWANAGPGAIRGLNRLYGRDLKRNPGATQTNEEMNTLMCDLNRHLISAADDRTLFFPHADEIDTLIDGLFEMRDVEHCLCEFDKYERVRLGEGQMRSKYDPRRTYTF